MMVLESILYIFQEVSQGWLTVSVFGRPVPGGTEYLGSLQEEDWSLAVTFFFVFIFLYLFLRSPWQETEPGKPGTRRCAPTRANLGDASSLTRPPDLSSSAAGQMGRDFDGCTDL